MYYLQVTIATKISYTLGLHDKNKPIIAGFI